MRTIMRTLTVLFGISCLLAAAEPKQKVQVEHTERADFPSGGLLRLKNSVGEVTVEGWDRPDVEITTIRSIYASRNRERASRDELDKVRVSVDRRGDELVVTTDFPRRRSAPPPVTLAPGKDFGSLTGLLTSPPSILLGASFDLEYRIKAPMNARLAADHDRGEVHVDNLTSDIHVTVLNGGITLHLPQEGQYGIDAKSDVGGVNSDFPGRTKRRPWLLGHKFVQGAPAAHKLYLRVGFGDIMILKPSRPGSVAASSGP
jgi:hypothetical protein